MVETAKMAIHLQSSGLASKDVCNPLQNMAVEWQINPLPPIPKCSVEELQSGTKLSHKSQP